jgi:hypothetical protein
VFRRINRERKLKWERAGLEGDIVKYHEARNYTPEDVIQAHYMEAIEIPPRTEVSNREMIADVSEEEEWRTEDESRFYRSNIEEPDYEANHTNVEESDHEAEEEYVPEDPYKEVKRFSELTEEEIDIVAENLRRVSPKFQNLIRPEMEGGQEEEDYKNIVEHYGTCSNLIYLAMPLNAEFIAQQNKDKKVDIEEKVDGEEENMGHLHILTNTPARESNNSTSSKKKLKKFHHSTDISSNEDDRPEERKKHRKKRFSKYSITSGSSSEEEEDVNKRSQARNISKQSTKPDSISVIPEKSRSESVIQQDEGSIPVGWKKKVDLN